MSTFTKLPELFYHCFQQFHQTKFLAYCLAIFMSSLMSYWLLLICNRSRRSFFLGKFVLLSAEKSDSNALQVGGIPFSIISLLSIGMLFFWFPYLINHEQARILHFSFYSWVGIFAYGYLDDRFEIRPIVKLISQLFLVSIFCLNAANVVAPTNSAIIFLIMTFTATAVLNGTNLIDGLDTLSYKVSAVIYLAFILLAANIISLPALFVASSCFFIMSGFYFFNREPSSVHLGEVGVSCIGFSYVVLATLIYQGYSRFNPPIYAFSKALLPLVIILVEVGVSFSRRMLNGKSPFRGDKLHLHHILHGIHKFSASTSSSIIAGSYFCFLMIAFYVMDPFSSITAVTVLIFLSVGWSFLLGHRYWFQGKIEMKFFEAMLVKEEVRIIPSNTLSEFRIELTVSEGESES
jgi:UDP-N-acetylmuramyl pentapeptide phosphotransferase/UDP-N-acetylglucosamine-1-phosphate transferase